MVSKDTGKSDYQKEIDNAIKRNMPLLKSIKEVKEDIEKEELILFISFDLVNSSKYKTRNYTSWFNVILTILDRLSFYIIKEIRGSQRWRTIGDETIFILNIVSINQLNFAIENVFKILNIVINEIKTGSILKGIMSDTDISIFKSQGLLSLKAAAWIAPVRKTNRLDFSEGKVSNLMYLYNVREGDGMPSYEFQGNDIDTGFRVSKNTMDRRFVLSLELAYLISETTSMMPRLNIVAFKRLKGIWDNRLYPVIWYHDKTVTNCSLQDSFFYDEDDDEEGLVYEYLNKEKEFPKIRDKYVSNNNVYECLTKIIKDRNLTDKIEDIKSLLEDGKRNSNRLIKEANRFLQVHCVAVCINKDNNEVLMLKRSENYNSEFEDLKGKWEFGCVTVVNGMSFTETLVKGYKNIANIDIKVREPFREYSFKNEDKITIPGIRFIAEIENPKDISIDNLSEEYSDFKFVSFDEFKNYTEKQKNECIDYLEFLDVFQYIESSNEKKESN